MYDARSRSRFRLLVTALTGAATVGSLTAAGVTTGALARAARDTEAGGDPADGASTAPAAAEVAGPARVVRWQDRPRRTVVRRHRVVQVAPAVPEGAAVPAPTDTLGGGTVTSAAPAAPGAPAAPAAPGGQPPPAPSGSGGGSGPAHPAPQPTSEPAPVPPPPAPAPPEPEPTVPSTGS